ncbi:hypothetical protein [Cellulomonas palmilytica]|uniref:hypothetical protein n=1 Tax=Cellulomonas palmilytica TaxID=2608402 RepID=UPI001F244F74|nr:hypothetical protein [Cellulomonas palmilytica]UJP41066.1 hypothetical protein F1D97_06315 [Cellulomonas palmilytica]
MADVTPLLSETTWHRMLDERELGWRGRVLIFLDYVAREDAQYCTIPDHATYESQRRITIQLADVARRIEVQTGAGGRRSSADTARG